MKYAPLALALVALPVWGDTVHLRNGATLEGKVVEAGDKVVVEMDFGRVTVSKIDVAKIAYDKSPLQELDEKVKAAKMDDPEAVYKIALWAKDRDLGNRAKELLQRVVELSPDHAGARGALGFRKHEGRWLTDDEYFGAIGMVKFRGAWMKSEEVEKIRLAEAEQQSKAASAASENLIRDAQRRVLEAEADLVKAKAETERVRGEIERVRQELRTKYVAYSPGFFWSSVRRGCCPPGCGCGHHAKAPAAEVPKK
jgi:hypothetical protein